MIIVNADDRQAGYFLDFWAEEKWGYTNENASSNKFNTNLSTDKTVIAAKSSRIDFSKVISLW